MPDSPRILFYFLHLLGVGHVYRAKRLIEGFSNAGMMTDVIYGGEPVPGISFEADNIHYLPPIKAADSTYASYLDENGLPLAKPFLQHRQDILMDVFDALHPDLILIEAFPFGRRMVRHELTAMLEEASKRKKKPIIASSVRDILQERKKPGRNQETQKLIDKYFDYILVHSDPEIIQLSETFPLTSKIDNKIHYTGFVLPGKNSSQAQIDTYDVIVSAGGGAFGSALMRTALEAANQRSDLSWCFATGPNLPDAERQQLTADSGSHVTVRRSLEDLAGHMRKAKVSISQCGYNTSMDVLAAHRDSNCRAIFVPFDTEGQTEQLKRSQLLEKAGYAINLPQSALTIEGILEAIDKALALPKVTHDVDFNGVKNSAKLIRSLIENT